MKYKDILWGIIIVVGLLVKPLFSTSTGGSEIFKKSSMTQEIFKGENQANKVERVDQKMMITELQRLTKIVSGLQSNDREMKNEMAQLTGRVSRLESSTPFEGDHSTEFKNRDKRQLSSNTAITLKPRCNKNCAFDYNTKGNWFKPMIPTSCNDLLKIGHVLNGFYPVLTGGKFKLVFCNFNAPKNQSMDTPMGFMDIKSSPVYFFLQKARERYSILNTPIPFEIVKLNVGNAMDTERGIFTAPKAGIYYFTFNGIKDADSKDSYVVLHLNGNQVALAHGPNMWGGLAMTLQATLQLKVGDKISLVLEGGVIHDFYNHYTNFVGMLLEEQDFVI